MLGHEPVGKLSHCGGCTLVLDVTQGVTTSVDLLTQPASFLACCNGTPVGGTTNGVTTLAPTPGHIVQDERSCPGSGDPDAETLHVRVVSDPVAPSRCGQFLDVGVREMLAHFPCVRSVSVLMTAYAV